MGVRQELSENPVRSTAKGCAAQVLMMLAKRAMTHAAS